MLFRSRLNPYQAAPGVMKAMMALEEQVTCTALEPSLAEYVEFHLRSVGCRICAANLDDLERATRTGGTATERRRRFFESSAGHLRGLSSGRAS